MARKQQGIVQEAFSGTPPAPSRRKRQAKGTFGTSKALMSEAEHMRDEIAEPSPRPNIVSVVVTITAIVTAFTTVVSNLKPSTLPDSQGYRLSGADLAIMFAAIGAAITQLVTFILSFKRSAHYLRAKQYADAMVADCKAQEEDEERALRPTRIQVGEEAGTEQGAEEGETEEEEADKPAKRGN